MHEKNMIGCFCYSTSPLIHNLSSLIHIQGSWNHNIQMSFRCFSSPFWISLLVFSLSSSLLPPRSALLALITHLEQGTLDKVSFFDQSEACHEPVLRKEKALTFKIKDLTMVLQLLCQDAGNCVLYHRSDCPREALFGTMDQERKTPGACTISTAPRRHLSTTAPGL